MSDTKNGGIKKKKKKKSWTKKLILLFVLHILRQFYGYFIYNKLEQLFFNFLSDQHVIRM
jgi:phosphatidylinositol kinase/protein kinase (PI-3  family)